MSTDINALEKQYARVQEKQHHACIVISGIKSGNMDDGKDSQLDVSKLEDSCQAAIAITRPVPMDMERNKRVVEPVSPKVPGETKCFFIQSKKNRKTPVKEQGEDILCQQFKATAVLEEKNKVDNSCCQEHAEGEKPMPEHMESKHIDDHALNNGKAKTQKCDEVTSAELDPNITAESNKNKSEEDKKEVQGAGCINTASDKTDSDRNSEHKDSKTEEAGEFAEKSSEVSCKVKELQTKDDDISVETTDTRNTVNDEGSGDTTSEGTCRSRHAALDSEHTNKQIHQNDPCFKDTCDIHANQKLSSPKRHEKTKFSHPDIKFSKQFYARRPHGAAATASRRRVNSVETESKQNIYQHFTFTKRQLSLDSGLLAEEKTNMYSHTLEFPFPVQLFNSHKIKTGIKLGLYDKTTLERLEKSQRRRSLKKKLPLLNLE